MRVWRNLTAVPLSPQQMEAAFRIALGGGRDTVRENMSIRDAVLRDCVKVIYEKLDCSSQAVFMAALHTAPESARVAAA